MTAFYFTFKLVVNYITVHKMVSGGMQISMTAYQPIDTTVRKMGWWNVSVVINH